MREGAQGVRVGPDRDDLNRSRERSNPAYNMTWSLPVLVASTTQRCHRRGSLSWPFHGVGASASAQFSQIGLVLVGIVPFVDSLRQGRAEVADEPPHIVELANGQAPVALSRNIDVGDCSRKRPCIV